MNEWTLPILIIGMILGAFAWDWICKHIDKKVSSTNDHLLERRREILLDLILDKEHERYPKVVRGKDGVIKEIPKLPVPPLDYSDGTSYAFHELRRILGLEK